VRGRIVRHAYDLVAAPRDHGVGAGGDRAEGGAQDLVAGNRIGEPERRGDENAARAFAHARHVDGATDDHLDAGGFDGGRFVGSLGRYLRGAPPASLERPKTGDRLAALDLASAEVEDARHQRFNFFA
jgi:hypothetical protein